MLMNSVKITTVDVSLCCFFRRRFRDLKFLTWHFVKTNRWMPHTLPWDVLLTKYFRRSIFWSSNMEFWWNDACKMGRLWWKSRRWPIAKFGQESWHVAFTGLFRSAWCYYHVRIRRHGVDFSIIYFLFQLFLPIIYVLFLEYEILIFDHIIFKITTWKFFFSAHLQSFCCRERGRYKEFGCIF